MILKWEHDLPHSGSAMIQIFPDLHTLTPEQVQQCCFISVSCSSPFPSSSLTDLLLPQEHLSSSLNIGFSWHLCDSFLLSVKKGKTSQVRAWSISPLMGYSHLFSCADFTIWWISKLKGSPYLSWHPQQRAMGTISVEYMNKTEKVWHQTACSWSPQCPHSPETK